jgi:molybdate transport system substrate-binding protein
VAANAVAFPAHGASGLYFVGLVERLGIKDEMQGKLRPMPAEDCVEMVARGEADFVVVVATRMVGVPGIEVAGPIPEALQTKIGFAAGLSAATKQPDTAKALLAFLSAPAAAATLKTNGVEPAN